ncbi:hypothetical protein TNCV_2208681 [Trichonephila clavipes]|nr:hypothetical protein TNCV_2208681 [Trichonephila clavipes]
MKWMHLGEKNMPIQRDKPSNFGEKTEDMPTQRDKTIQSGCIVQIDTISPWCTRKCQSPRAHHRAGGQAGNPGIREVQIRQVALQAEPFVNVTVGPAVLVCREEVGVIHRDTNHFGLCAILRYAGNGQFNRNRLTTMVKHVGMGKKR